ncbi:MAG: LLM class flavin-dependent oxidoreductase, partial [Bacteroidia bacterium]|nr:LLM class flavin-dependent oxidoreductase [Bacteroidia bacterium]
ENPEIDLAAVSLLSEQEENVLLNHFGGTLSEIPQTTIPHLIKAQAITSKDKTAIYSGNTKLSYSELWDLCGIIAGNLKENFNILPGDVVAVKISRTEYLVPCLLSLMSMNVTYVPVDANYPAERIKYIITDCAATLLIDDDLLKKLIYTKTNAIAFEPCTKTNSLAYILYTSGSTGQPKGVKVSHENLVNFVLAMNKDLPANSNNHILAVTSVSFDISFLELIWPLTNGMTITIKEDATKVTDFNEFLNEEPAKHLDFGLFFFASYQNHNPKDSRYKLFLETTVYADRNGYSAVWTPERHFHDFGGLFADSSITCAAISQITNTIELRSGSCVIPLHDTLRVAEQWSMIDNLSNGRISLSLATGWNANDFVFYPERYEKRKDVFYDQIKELQHLWSGGFVQRKNGIGKTIEVKMFPQPVQNILPIWITSSGNPETFKEAGEGGFHLLTHLLGQSIEILEENLKIYFNALEKNGHDRSKVKVALMLHTYVGENIHEVKELVRAPFKNYLASSLGLLHSLAKGLNIDMAGENLEQYKEELLEMGFERYWNTSALLGTQETCSELLKKIAAIGVTEIACLVDFGLKGEDVMEGLTRLDLLKESFSKAKQKSILTDTAPAKIDFLQSTPSLLKLMADDRNSHRFLRSLNTIVAGGEALPVSLLKKIREITKATLYNVYGPTETTIWSTVKHLEDENVNVGKPVLNTEIFVLDKKMNLVPVGVKGDVYIGGKGVAA